MVFSCLYHAKPSTPTAVMLPPKQPKRSSKERRDVAAEATKAFQQGHRYTGPGCADGCRQTAGTRSDNQDIGFLDYIYFTRRFSKFIDTRNAW